MPKSFYIIDGHAQIFRAYFAPFRDLTSPTGEPTKATFVFTQMLMNLIDKRKPDYLAMVIDRLQAYSEAGADCLYAPGIKTKEQISAVVKAVHPKPVNLLIGASGLSLAEAADLGVRRISVGGSLARTAWTGFMRTAKEMAEKGTFTELASGYPGGELNKMFS